MEDGLDVGDTITWENNTIGNAIRKRKMIPPTGPCVSRNL